MPNAAALPTPKQEAWKFTNLARTVQSLNCTPLCTTLECLEAALPIVSGPQLVFHNGILVPQLSQAQSLPPSITFTAAPAAKASVISDELDSLPIATIHTLNVSDALAQPLHLIHVASGTPTAYAIHITLENGAAATIIEHHVAAPKTVTWQHLSATVTVGSGAVLTHSVLADHPPHCVLSRRTRIRLQPRASYVAAQLAVGGLLTRMETLATLTANTTFAYTGLALGRRNQHHDATLAITHQGESNSTTIRQRNILDDEANGVFQGKFYVAQAAQFTNAYMHCHNLLLSDSARTSHKPELEIYADDVKCSHGAATGGLNPQQLFYLQARGLTPHAARALLTVGFAQEFLEAFPDTLHTTLAGRLQAWLEGDRQSEGEAPDFGQLQGEWVTDKPAARPHLRVIKDAQDAPQQEEVTDE